MFLPRISRPWAALAVVYLFFVSSMSFAEVRKVTQEDVEWGDPATTVTSAGGHVGHRIDNTFQLSSPYIDIRTYLPENHVTNGSVNYSTQIQAAIDAAEAKPGTKILFPTGQYSIGTTGISVNGNGVILEGVSPRFVGASAFGVEFLYSGTGTAVTFGAADVINYRNEFNNIQVRATGDAITSATAIGVKTINQHYLTSRNAAIKDFSAGIGLYLTAAGTSMFGATCQYQGLLMHQNKTGIKAVGIDDSIKDNHAVFFGGGIIGASPVVAGSIGVDIDQYTSGYMFYGTDVESFATGFKLAGDHTTLFGIRTEFIDNNHIQIESTASHTQIYGPNYYSGVVANWVSDANGDTSYIGSRSNVRIMPNYLYILNGIPITMEDNTAIGRNVIYPDPSSNRLRFGTTSGFNGNYADGDWYVATESNTFNIMGQDQFHIDDISSYENNAAAVSGGLAVGTVYRTSTGVLMLVY